MTIAVILISLLFIFLLISFAAYSRKLSKRKKETSDWEVGDLVAISGQDGLLKLVGWAEDYFYVEIDGIVNKTDWDTLRFNKSATWRRNWNECKEYMGEKKPGFSPGLKTSTHLKVDGKPVETLTEVECEVYLKRALEEENYELATAIRKRAEKFR
jgi:hypothetical protein